MGAFRMGSARMKTSSTFAFAASASALTGAILILFACGDATIIDHTAYAEIVAEEDARGERGLDRTRHHLASEDPAVRRLAVRALGRLEDPAQLERIGEFLEDEDISVRATAAAALAQAVFGEPSEAAGRALAARIDVQTNPSVLSSFATNLGRIVPGSPAAQAETDAALVQAATRLRIPADYPGLIGHVGLARGIDAFARAIQPDGRLSAELLAVVDSLGSVQAPASGVRATRAARVRRLAAAALVTTGQIDAEAVLALLQDSDWGVRRQAMIAATRHGTAAAEVVPAGLADPHWRVRLDALAAFDRWMRPAAGCDAIIAAVTDPNPHVAATAIGLAGRPCPDRAAQVSALRARAAEIDDPDADWRAPARALHALAAIAPEVAAEDLTRLAAHANPFARAWAARAAAVLGDHATLTRLAADPIPNVREAALRGLAAVSEAGASPTPGLTDIYAAQLESNDPQLVMTATRLLVARAGADAPLPQLLAALARFTAAERETERDVRAALLDGIGAVGGFSRDDLAPYLTDFDPVIAERAAELLTTATGQAHAAVPQPLPRTPTPTAARLRDLERSTVVLHMEGLGDIVIALRPDLAATNADRFARLAAEGYFDGLTFHRVEPNFVIQGGSPHANEFAGDGPYSRDEISGAAHWRGTVGLSTRGRDTGDAQIFINLVDNLRLDFNYTIYGVVVEGMEVVDAVQEGAVIETAEVLTRPADPAIALAQSADSAIALARRVTIHRTDYGVPHIFADDLKSMGFGLGYVQSEDYSVSIAMAMMGSRGTLARHLGPEELDADFAARPVHARAVATFHRLDPNTQDVYRGFAEGVNHYIRLHRDEFPEWVTPDFTGVDALARDVQGWSRADAARFVARLRAEEAPDQPPASFALDGSNAWAFHGSRTASGNPILLRNPHLTWEGRQDLLERVSGLTYYEGHVRVPGVIDFYGDFRIGTAFGIIGGFNDRLGWATTNNYPTLSQVYKLNAHPDLEDHALLDGQPLPLERREVSVDYLTAGGESAVETRVSWHTPHGPVIHRTDEHVYLLKDPRDGEFRRGEQFLRMMMAKDLDEWLEVMKTRAHPTSNFTYADRNGNIVHYYNARLPLLPHPVTGDTAAFAANSADMWSELVPWESLPLYINPPGGYVQQANDTPDYTNLNVPMDRDTVPHNLPEPRLRLRSQLSLELAAGAEGAAGPEGAAEPGARLLTLEDVVELKHTPRMLLAERVIDDLLAAARAAEDAAVQEAVQVLSNWDLTANADSRGGVLFALWANQYFDGNFEGAADPRRWREPWDPMRPTATPYGVSDPDSAVRALGRAVESLRTEGIALDAEWGQVHRVIRGDVDEPVSGCSPTLGCFRVLSFAPTEDGRLAANRGDSWVFVVEFGEVPRARTVLAYGQTARPSAPHHADQAAMFAHGETKEVAWTDEDIHRRAIASYRPGEEIRR